MPNQIDNLIAIEPVFKSYDKQHDFIKSTAELDSLIDPQKFSNKETLNKASIYAKNCLLSLSDYQISSKKWLAYSKPTINNLINKFKQLLEMYIDKAFLNYTHISANKSSQKKLSKYVIKCSDTTSLIIARKHEQDFIEDNKENLMYDYLTEFLNQAFDLKKLNLDSGINDKKVDFLKRQFKIQIEDYIPNAFSSKTGWFVNQDYIGFILDNKKVSIYRTSNDIVAAQTLQSGSTSDYQPQLSIKTATNDIVILLTFAIGPFMSLNTLKPSNSYFSHYKENRLFSKWNRMELDHYTGLIADIETYQGKLSELSRLSDLEDLVKESKVLTYINQTIHALKNLMQFFNAAVECQNNSELEFLINRIQTEVDFNQIKEDLTKIITLDTELLRLKSL